MAVLLPTIAIIAVILVLYFSSASARSDPVSNNTANPNYPPPPSLGSFGDAAIEFFRIGIPKAEGFGIPGKIPTLAHNPGDLVIPNWQGQKLGPEGISVFSSDAEGYNRLRFQLYLIGSEQSANFSLDMTIAQMAQKWTRTDPDNWARIVAGSIGTTTDTTLRDLFQGTAS